MSARAQNGAGERLALVALDRDVEHQAGRRVIGPDAGEIGGAAKAAALGEDAQHAADLAGVMAAERRLASLAQAPRPLLDDLPRDGRHFRGRRSGPGGKRKDMQIGQPAILDEAKRVFKHRVGLGRKAGDEIGAEDISGRSRRNRAQKSTAPSRECRRFMRFRIMSSPA